MQTALSVNLNKIALVRNSRINTIPDPVLAAITCIQAGAHGITVHPRPDQRHIRPDDVARIAHLLASQHPHIEHNIEGNPFAGPESNRYPGYMAIVEAARPAQATLVPDSPDQLTSDHGWHITPNAARLEPIIAQLNAWGCRVSLFVDHDISTPELKLAHTLGVARVELYTGPYAEAIGTSSEQATLDSYTAAAHRALDAGLEINAGHDLNCGNLRRFLEAVPGVKEVSIGHALIADALMLGLHAAVEAFIDCIPR